MRTGGREPASYCFANIHSLFQSVAMNAVKRCPTLPRASRKYLLRGCLFAAATFLLCYGSAYAQLLFVNGQSVQSHVAQLRSQVLQRDSQEYIVPTAGQLSDFRSLADGLRDAQSTTDLQSLLPAATALGYDVVVLNDAGSTFYGLQETATIGSQKGWGSFFLRQGASNSALVEVAHPLADINTTDVSAQVFVDSEAKGFLLAGAHRNANGSGTADVAHLNESIFQEVHQSFADNAPNLSVWQVHGFNIDLHPEVPSDTDAILSSGTGSVTELVLGLDQNIDGLPGNFTSYAFNTLSVSDPLNVATNGNVTGSVFSQLGGTTNVQRQHTSSIGGQFVHIELEQSFRIDGGESARQLASQSIANAIISSAIAVPEPSTFAILGIVGMCFLTRRRREDGIKKAAHKKLRAALID